jgi:hypothetical protein
MSDPAKKWTSVNYGVLVDIARLARSGTSPGGVGAGMLPAGAGDRSSIWIKDVDKGWFGKEKGGHDFS